MTTSKKTASLILSIILGLVVSIGLSYVSAAGVWNNPPLNPPEGNTVMPVHVGSEYQIKGATGSAGGLGVNEFVAAQNAQFNAVTAIRGLVIGLAGAVPDRSTLSIGDSTSTVNLAITGNEYTYSGGLYASNITTAAPGELRPLCSNKDGKIIFCNQSTLPPSTQTYHVVANAVYWCTDYRDGNDFHQGKGHLQLKFSAPTPVPFTMKVAFCMDNPGSTLNDTCHGVPLIPGGAPSGYITSPGQPWTINVPAGVSVFTTPNVWMNDSGGIHMTCLNNGSKQNTKVSQVTRLYFKLTHPTSGFTYNFNGTSFQPNFTQASNITVYQVP